MHFLIARNIIQFQTTVRALRHLFSFGSITTPPTPSFPPAKILEKINTLSACDFTREIREKEVPQSHVASRVNTGIWLQKEWNDARDPLLQPPLLLLISPHHGQMAAISILPSFTPAKSNTEFMWFGAYSAQCEVWNTHTHQTLVTELHGSSLGRKTCLIVAAYITSVSVHSVWAVACIDFSMYGFVFQDSVCFILFHQLFCSSSWILAHPELRSTVMKRVCLKLLV